MQMVTLSSHFILPDVHTPARSPSVSAARLAVPYNVTGPGEHACLFRSYTALGREVVNPSLSTAGGLADSCSVARRRSGRVPWFSPTPHRARRPASTLSRCENLKPFTSFTMLRTDTGASRLAGALRPPPRVRSGQEQRAALRAASSAQALETQPPVPPRSQTPGTSRARRLLRGRRRPRRRRPPLRVPRERAGPPPPQGVSRAGRRSHCRLGGPRGGFLPGGPGEHARAQAGVAVRPGARPAAPFARSAARQSSQPRAVLGAA